MPTTLAGIFSMINPLLATADLPSFAAIQPEHVEPAIERILTENRDAIERLLAAHVEYTWANLIEPLEALEDRLNKAWSPVSHLHGVMDSEALRRAYNACLPKLSAYATEIGQHEPLYRAYRRIAEGPEYGRLDRAQRKVIDNALRDFRLSGIALPPAQQARYKEIQQELSHQFYKDWTGPTYPRMLIIEIQHPTPYYDDSYAVNTPNQGPYGDAINEELIPYIEKTFRGLGTPWSRFMYGGSTGGWEALAVQVMYPDFYNGCFAACPDPIDFRAFTSVNIYDDENAYYAKGPWKVVARPAHRNYLGHISATVEQMNRMESVLGSKGRSGGQFDIWTATYSPVGPDGYPKPIWDRATGKIDKEVATYWRENYDLTHIMKRDWDKGLGKKLEGKVNIYVGDMDNYYLNNAVYLAEDFLKSTTNPPFGGEVDYGDRAEHCWNGDHTRSNAYSRLRYHQMFAPKIVERILKTAPAGADVTSWRY